MFLFSCVVAAQERCRQLDFRAAELRSKAWAPSSWKTKTSQWRRYIRFCASIRCAALPTNCKLMCRYAVELSSSLRYSTIQNYVSGVLSLNRYFGHDAKGVRSDYEFIMTMSGIRRVLGDPTPVRPSFTLQDLIGLSKWVDFSNPEERCMWACVALSFRALLRKSNIVPDSSSNPEGHYLKRGAVSWTEWGLEVKVSSS